MTDNLLNTHDLALTVATSNDRVYKIELDAANRIKKEIDPYGLVDDYERDCAGLITTHTDRAGYKTVNEYDKARRHVAEELPQQSVTHLTTKKNADGSMVISAERHNRRIRNELLVNRLNKTYGKKLDARIATTTYPIDTRNVSVSYDLDGEEIGIVVAGVKVDDATQNASSDLTVLPTKTVDIETCKVLNSSKKVLVEYKCIKSGDSDSYQNMHFYIYDALGYLSFEILPNRSVIQYKRNEFGQEQDTIRYGDLLISEAFLSSKKETGISHEEMQQKFAADIKPLITATSDIRSSHFEYHANGLLKSVSKTKRDYYNPISRTFEKGEPTTENTYDGLGRLISQKTLQYKTPTEVWHKKYFWYQPGEKKACMTAESFQPSAGGNWANHFSLIKDEFDVFGDHIKTHVLDSAVILPPKREDISLAGVSTLFDSAIYTEKDVVQQFKTGKNGKQSLLIEKDIKVADPTTLVAKTKTVGTLTKDITTQFKYGKRDEPTQIIHPNGAIEWFFYDANKHKVAQVGMPVLYFDDETQKEVTIYPLQVFYYNAHGEQVQSVKYRMGIDQALLGDAFNPYTLPTEIKAATNNAIWHSEVRDSRGMVMIEQKGHTTTNLTYDHNKSLVRSYLKRKKAASDGTGYHIDETRLALDQKSNVLELSKYRNGIKQNELSTVTLYNAYDENVSQHRAHKPSDKLRHKILQGLAWMSHDLKTGAPELHFSDLMGNRTLSLKSRDFDLDSLATIDAAITYVNAHQSWQDHQREEYIPNTSGDELTHYPTAHREMRPTSAVTTISDAVAIHLRYSSQRKLAITLPDVAANIPESHVPFIRLYTTTEPRTAIPLTEGSRDLHLVKCTKVDGRWQATVDSIRSLGGVGRYEAEVYYYNPNHIEGVNPFRGMVPTHSATYELPIVSQDLCGGDLLKNGNGIRSLRYDIKVIGSIPGGNANPNSKVEFLLGGDIPSEIRSGTIRLNFKPGKAQVSYMDITFARGKNSKTFLISGDLLVSQYFNKDITDSVNVTLADAKGNTATLIYKSSNFKINADGRSATIGSAAFRYIVKQNRLPQECYLNYDSKLGASVPNKTVIKTSANAFAGIMVYNEPADKKDHNIFVFNVPAKRLTKKDSSRPLVWPEGTVPVASDHYIGITVDTHHRGVDIHDVRGGHTKTDFTNRGNVQQITHPLAKQAVPITPANTTAVSERTYKHARLSKVERRFHNEMNELVVKQVGYQDEGVTTIAFDPITLFERMLNGQLLRITDPHGTLRSEHYRDGFDQPSSYRGRGAKKRWQLVYSANQLVEILIPNIYLNGKYQHEGKVSERVTLSYKLIYDHTDELIGLYVPWERVKKDGKDVWTYAQMNFRYDASGQISHRIMPASTGAGIQETKMQRDALGKEIYVVSPINAEAGIDGDFSDRQSSIASLSAFDRQIVNTIVSAKKKSTLYVRHGMTSAIDRSLDSSGDDWTYTRNFFGTLNRLQQTGRGRARNQDHALPLNKYYELETTKIAEIGSVGKTHVKGKDKPVPLGDYEYTWEGDMLVKQEDNRLNIETSYKRDHGLEITSIEHKDKTSGKVIDKTNRTIDILGRCILSSTYRLDASGSATMAFSKAQHFDLEARRIIISLTMHAYPKITIQFGYGYDPAGNPLHDCVPIYINGNRFTLKKPSTTQGKYYIYDSYGEPIHETYHHGVDVTNFFDDLMRLNRSEVKGCFTTAGIQETVSIDATRHPSGYVSQQVPKDTAALATITKMTKNFVAMYKGDKKYKFFKRLEAGHIMEDGLTPTVVDHYDADVDAGKTPEHHENYVYKYMFELGQAIPTSYAGQGEDLKQKLTGYSRITVPYYIGQILAATGSDIRGTSRDDVGSMDEIEKLSVAKWADESCVVTITTILNFSGYNYRQTHHLFVNEQGMVEGELVTTDLGPDEKYVTERTGGVVQPDTGKNRPQYVTYKDSKGVSHYQKFMGQYVIKPRGMFRIDHDYEDAYFKSAVKLGESTAEQARAAIASFTDLASMQPEKVKLEDAPAAVPYLHRRRRDLAAEREELGEPETRKVTPAEAADIRARKLANAEHETELEKLLTLTHIRPEEYTAIQAIIEAIPKRHKTERPAADNNYYLPANFFKRLPTDANLQHLQEMLTAMFASRSAQQCYEFLTELAIRNDYTAIAHYIPRQPSVAHAFSLLMCTITASLDEIEQITVALHYEKNNQRGETFDYGAALNHSVAIVADLPSKMFTEESIGDGILDEVDCRTLQRVKTVIVEEYRQWLKEHSQPQQPKGWFSFFSGACPTTEPQLLQFWAPTFERGKLRESSLITMINKYHQHSPHAVLNEASLQLGFSHLPILMREQTPAMYYMVIRELVYRGAQDDDVHFSIKGTTVFNKVVNKARSQLAGHEAEFNRLISRSLAKHPLTIREPSVVEELAMTRMSGAASSALTVYDRNKAAKDATAISSLSSRGTVGNGFANGLKIGELHDSSPLITRLATDPTWRNIKEDTLISDIEKELPPHMVAILNLMFPDGKLPAGLSIPAEPNTMPTDQEIIGDVNTVVASLMHLGNPTISYYDQYLENLNQDDGEMWGMFAMVVAGALTVVTLGTSTPLMAAVVASGSDAGLQALGMAVGANHKFNIAETIAAGLGAAVGSGAGQLTSDLLGKAGNTFTRLLAERVASAAAQNATSQLTRFALSGGRVNFNKQAFYSAIATAAASAAIEFNLGGNKGELSTSRNKYAREQVRAKILSSVAAEGIDAAINHRDIKLDRLIANAVTTGITTAAETSDVQLGITHKPDPRVQSTKGGAKNRYQAKAVPSKKQASASQAVPTITLNAGGGTHTHYTGEGNSSSDIHSVDKAEGDLAAQEFYQHWDYYLPAESSFTPSISTNSAKSAERVRHQLQQQVEQNPGASKHAPESTPMDYGSWQLKPAPSKWERFKTGFWSGIDATNRSYEHTMGSLVAPVRGLKYLYDHPDAITKGINYVSSHPGEVVASIGNSLERTATKFANGDTITKYEMLLNGFSDTVTGTFTGGAAAKATTTAAAAGTKLVGATLTHTKSAGLLLAGIVKTGEKVPNSVVADEISALGRIGVNAKTYQPLHQTVRLKGSVVDEFLSQSAGLSRNQVKKNVGPVIGGVMDKKTGQIFLGSNHPSGLPPEVLHPLLEERVFEAAAIKYVKTHGAGSHAEIYALNDALHARPGAVLDDFLLYTINSGQRTSVARWGMPVPRCPHCEYITSGVDFHPSPLIYGK